MRPVMLSLLALLLLSPAAARGQAPDPNTPVSSEAPAEVLEPAPGAPAAAGAQPGYAPVGSGLPERAAPPRTLRAHWHVFAAFAVTLVLLFGYALSLGRRFGRLDEELSRLGRQG